MLRLGLALLLFFFAAMPMVFAQQPLSPEQVELLPFSTTGARMPKTETLMETLTTEEDVSKKNGNTSLPQFNTDTFASQLFWLFVSFSTLYFFFSRVALPKLSSVIEDRIMTIRGDLEEAEKLSHDAEITKKSYEEAISEAHNNAHAYVNEVTDALRQDEVSTAEIFKEKSLAEIENLEKQAEKAKQKIKVDLNETLVMLTSDIVTKLSDTAVKQSDIEKMVTKLLNNKQAA